MYSDLTGKQCKTIGLRRVDIAQYDPVFIPAMQKKSTWLVSEVTMIMTIQKSNS